MHMATVIGGGLAQLGIFLLFGKLWSGSAAGLAPAAKLFIPVWAVIALVNMWVGVTKAGYTVRAELPILFVVFAIPAVVALFLASRLAR